MAGGEQKEADAGGVAQKQLPVANKNTGARAKRQARVGFFFFWLVIIGLKLLAWTNLFMATLEFEYEPGDSELLVTTGGCDVHIESGKKSIVTVTRATSRTGAPVTTFDPGSRGLRALNLEHSAGCLDLPSFDCSLMCLITITINNDDPPNKIKVRQLDADVGRVDVTATGVTFATLDVRGRGLACNLTDVSATKNIWLQIQTAPITITDTKAHDIYAYSNSAPVYITRPALLDSADDQRQPTLNLEYRTNDQRTAIVYPNATHQLTLPPNPWAKCPLDDPLIGQQVQEYYDTDMNYRITPAEFSEGLNKMPKCCGSGCPQVSFCHIMLVPEMFPMTTMESVGGEGVGAGYVSIKEFLHKIKDNNDTSLAPCFKRNCVNGATVTAVDPAERGTEQITITAKSDAANVRIDLRPIETKRYGAMQRTHCSAGGVTGIHMLASDVAVFKAEIQAQYGAIEATADILLVVDVIGAGHVQQGRFVWATRPIYLDLEPALLSFFSLGLLNPNVKRIRIYVGDHFCSDGPPPSEAEVKLLIYEQLFKTINPLYQDVMRGAMVYIEHDHMTRPLKRSMTTYVSDEQCAASEPGENCLGIGPWAQHSFEPPLEQWTDAAVLISLCLSGVVTVMVVSGFNYLASGALRKAAKDRELKEKMSQMRDPESTEAYKREQRQKYEQALSAHKAELSARQAEYDLEEKGPLVAGVRKASILVHEGAKELFDSVNLLGNGVTEAEAKEEESKKRAKVAKGKNAFMYPVQMVEVLLMAPLRRSMTNSLDTFVKQRCMTVAKFKKQQEANRRKARRRGQVMDVHQEENELKDFCDEETSWIDFERLYSTFCFEEGLKEETDMEIIRQYMVGDVNARVKCVTVDVLSGVAWKDADAQLQEGLKFEAVPPSDSNADPPLENVIRIKSKPSTGSSTDADSNARRASVDPERLVDEFIDEANDDGGGSRNDGPPALVRGQTAIWKELNALGEAVKQENGLLGAMKEEVAAQQAASVEYTPEELLDMFLEEKCVITNRDVDSIPWKAKRDQDNRIVTPGFETSFQRFCKMHGYYTPPIPVVFLSAHGVRRLQGKVFKLSSIRFLRDEESSGAVTTTKEYLFTALLVFMHLAIFVGLPLLAMASLLELQTIYALTTASGIRPALTGWDLLLRPQESSGGLMGLLAKYDIVPFVQVGSAGLLVYIGIVLLRLLTEYSLIPKEGTYAKHAIRVSFAWLTIFMIVLVMWRFGIVLVWFVLAAALDPSKNLPFGIGVVTVRYS
mmetsp:Transcript_72468/g.206329  ORF Transcript_72468/g.206329 Transcript_72468/m.206329 type:complete len:1255 (-) Transcript_72468:131-3895(-)